MFGIGPGELLLIVVIAFFVAPREIPRLFRLLGTLYRSGDRLQAVLDRLDQADEAKPPRPKASPARKQTGQGGRKKSGR